MARYNLELSSTLDAELTVLARKLRVSKAEVVHRALVYYITLSDEKDKGAKFLIEYGQEPSGITQRELIVR